MLNIPATLVLSILMGVCLGFSLNMLNVRVAPEYFGRVTAVSTPTTVAIFHGIVEGGLLGLVVGVLFTLLAGGFAWRHFRFGNTIVPLTMCYAAAATCIVIGGVAGSTFGRLDPAGYQALFPVARRASSLPAFGWVGGSIWGSYAGSFVGLYVGCRWFLRRTRTLDRQVRGFPLEESAANGSRMGATR
ncbi:MAG: hypothetical protein AAF743_09715 [Planctomycetota bacterium]